jgi:hypothetical protein
MLFYFFISSITVFGIRLKFPAVILPIVKLPIRTRTNRVTVRLHAFAMRRTGVCDLRLR